MNQVLQVCRVITLVTCVQGVPVLICAEDIRLVLGCRSHRSRALFPPSSIPDSRSLARSLEVCWRSLRKSLRVLLNSSAQLSLWFLHKLVQNLVTDARLPLVDRSCLKFHPAGVIQWWWHECVSVCICAPLPRCTLLYWVILQCERKAVYNHIILEGQSNFLMHQCVCACVWFIFSCGWKQSPMNTVLCILWL